VNRAALCLPGVVLCCGLTSSGMMHAQERPAGYPARPIRIIVSSVPGGGLDMICRTVAQMLTERWGQTVVVDNRTGGGTVVATEIGARAPADGYTLFAGTDTLHIVGATKRVPFDVRKAFDPVVPMTQQPYILMIQPGLPVKSVKELAAHSQTQALSYGSSGVGTAGHLGMEQLATLAKAKFVHVPYKGGAASMLGVLGGEIHMYPGVLLSAASAIKTGKLRTLAAMGLKRVPVLPDLPTVAEQGFPGFKIVNSYGLYAPAGTPKPILLALNRAVGEFMASPKMTQKLISEGSQPPDERLTPEQFKAYLAHEYEEVERQVKHLDVKFF
jgi:tripartite-type tricarboxylate transporter receptor subunit TctC